MEKITSNQQACIHLLINKLNLKHSKKAIIAGFSATQSESSKELSKEEAQELIKYLKSQDPEEKKAEHLKRTIISMAHECGYETPGTGKVDMKKLDGWCVTYGQYKKKLNSHTYSELVQLVTQFKARYASFLRAF